MDGVREMWEVNLVELGDGLGENSSLAWTTGLMECLFIDMGKEKEPGVWRNYREQHNAISQMTVTKAPSLGKGDTASLWHLCVGTSYRMEV